MNSLVRRHGSEAGIALPITLILMALITSLTVAFLAFTSAEPVIASNQMANSQARAIAESGIERALSERERLVPAAADRSQPAGQHRPARRRPEGDDPRRHRPGAG